MSARRIRNFFLKQPKPVSVRVSGEFETQTLALGRNYARCAETVDALGADLIECLDGKGNLLRAMRPNDEESQRSDAASIPAGLSDDPNALLLSHFGNLLHRAYEHSTEIAFTKMVEIFDIMASRSESIEQRLERTEAQNRRLHDEQHEMELEQVEAAAASKDDTGDLLQSIAGAFAGGKAQAAQKTPNGKA